MKTGTCKCEPGYNICAECQRFIRSVNRTPDIDKMETSLVRGAAEAWVDESHLLGSAFCREGGLEAFMAGAVWALERAATEMVECGHGNLAEAIRKLSLSGESLYGPSS